MSSSTPLLPRSNNEVPPIFLRVCHSPWLCINQTGLAIIRMLLAMYLLGAYIVIVDYELNVEETGWMILFKLANITFFAQVIYYVLTATWTYMHLYHVREYNDEWHRLLSPPRHSVSSKRHTLFHYFYSAVTTFPHVVTMLYWLLVVPHQEPTAMDKNCELHDKYFTLANLYGVNSGVALFEVLVLSSAAFSHSIVMGFLSLLYVLWANFGKLVVGKYPYYFFDNSGYCWQHFFTTVVAFVGLTEIFYTVNYGLTGIREQYARKGEDRSSGGYRRLAQRA